MGLSLLDTFVDICPTFAYPPPAWAATRRHVGEYMFWALFVIDDALQLSLAPSQWWFVKQEWLAPRDVVVPIFRPIRAVRSALFL